jgi:hypothetical protein
MVDTDPSRYVAEARAFKWLTKVVLSEMQMINNGDSVTLEKEPEGFFADARLVRGEAEVLIQIKSSEIT